MTTDNASLHLAVALDGAGWHPAAWREPDVDARHLFTAAYWVDLARRAETGLLDFLTIEDGLQLQSDSPWAPDERTDRVRGRLDAVLTAARIAPTTEHIGLVPTAITTHTEPFHLSKSVATLDFVSHGRGGVRVQIAGRSDTARHFGRRQLPDYRPDQLDDPEVRRVVAAHFQEATDYVEVVRRLWDSWEDDAEIREVATGRFIDREKLHHVDFQGEWFSVKGPSITPRPPQGQPLVVALGHGSIPYRFLARAADVGLVTPQDRASAAAIVGEIRGHQADAGRSAEALHLFGEVTVFLGSTGEEARERKARLDDWAGSDYQSDAQVFVGTAAELADLLLDWQGGGLSGFRLRPGALPFDLDQITGALVPELQRRGAFRRRYAGGSLRARLGLHRPANRYATPEEIGAR